MQWYKEDLCWKNYVPSVNAKRQVFLRSRPKNAKTVPSCQIWASHHLQKRQGVAARSTIRLGHNVAMDSPMTDDPTNEQMSQASKVAWHRHVKRTCVCFWRLFANYPMMCWSIYQTKETFTEFPNVPPKADCCGVSSAPSPSSSCHLWSSCCAPLALPSLKGDWIFIESSLNICQTMSNQTSRQLWYIHTSQSLYQLPSRSIPRNCKTPLHWQALSFPSLTLAMAQNPPANPQQTTGFQRVLFHRKTRNHTRQAKAGGFFEAVSSHRGQRLKRPREANFGFHPFQIFFSRKKWFVISCGN